MVLRFIICSLISWICLPPEIPPSLPQNNAPAPVIVQTPIESPQNSENGPYQSIGKIWIGIGEKDTGHCPGYSMPSGSGYPPSLIWPIASQETNPNRGYRVGHPALDIYANEGDVVWSAAPGTVVWAGWSSWGFGETVAVNHGGGYYTLYGHLSEVTAVCGQWVGAGTMIGKVGMTGASNFFHLHFEIRNGNLSYNPLQFVN